MEMIVVSLASLLAGFVDSIVGGGGVVLGPALCATFPPPHPDFESPGGKLGQRWCLCSARWQEALQAGKAPQVVLESTSFAALEVVRLADLKRYAAKLDQEK